MRATLFHFVVLATLGVFNLWGSGLVMADDTDHDRARHALEAGEVLPLSAILARLEATHPGQVMEVELERDHGGWIYEIKLMQEGGKLVKLKLDGRDGSVLRSRVRERDVTDD